MKISEIKKYDYSYTLGAFPTFELVNRIPEQVECVLVHSKISNEIKKKIYTECGRKKVNI